MEKHRLGHTTSVEGYFINIHSSYILNFVLHSFNKIDTLLKVNFLCFMLRVFTHQERFAVASSVKGKTSKEA